MKKLTIPLTLLTLAITLSLPSCSGDDGSQMGDTEYFTRNLMSASLPDGSTMFFTKKGDGVAVTYDQSNIRMLEDGKAALTTYQGGVVIPETITVNGETFNVIGIDNWAFSNCRNVTAIKIPATVSALGDACFSRTSGLKEVNIPESITAIPSSCFIGCSSLTELELPESIACVGDKAFWGCTKLSTLRLHSVTPPTASGELTTDYSVTTVYVPADCVEAYKNHIEWGKFNIVSE